MDRNKLVRAVDAIEDLMIDTGKGTTRVDRIIWWACKSIWSTLQQILKRSKKDGSIEM